MSSLALGLLCLLFCLLLATGRSSLLFAQLPANTPLYSANAKWVTDHGSQVWNVRGYGDGATNGIASAITACGLVQICDVLVPSSYPTTEIVPGSGTYGAGTMYYGAATSPLIQITDNRYGDFQTAVDPPGLFASGTTGLRNWHQWTANYHQDHPSYPSDLGMLSLNMNVINGGHNIRTTTPSYTNKTAYGPFNVGLRNHSYGESQPGGFSAECFGTGDCLPLSVVATYYGGRTAGGDEGQELMDLEGLQGSTSYINTISSGGGLGSTSLALSGSPSQGAGTQGAGRYLLDCGTGVSSSDCSTGSNVYKTGTISAIAAPGSGPQVFTGSGTSWPASTVNTTTTSAVSAPGSATVTVASSSGITTSTVLRIFSNMNYGSMEDVLPSAVGSGSFTATFRYPHPSGSVVASGGLSSSCLELTADTVPTGYSGLSTTTTPIRRAWPIILSTSSTSLTAWSGYTVSGATTAWTNTSGQNGYAIYPCAEATAWEGTGSSAGQLSNIATLEQNAVNWANGDTVELALNPFPYISMGSWIMQGWWPGTMGGTGIRYTGVASDFYGFTLLNATPATKYVHQGGYLGAPIGYTLYGDWSTGLMMRQGYDLQAVGIDFQGPPGGGAVNGYVMTPVQVWSRAGDGYEQFYYDQYNGIWGLTTGGHASGGNYTFPPPGAGNAFNFPEHIGGLNNDSQGAITISSGVSASYSFAHSYTNAPICTLTPTSDPTSVGTWWVTTTTSAVTANVHTSGSITFNYTCMANPK